MTFNALKKTSKFSLFNSDTPYETYDVDENGNVTLPSTGNGNPYTKTFTDMHLENKSFENFVKIVDRHVNYSDSTLQNFLKTIGKNNNKVRLTLKINNTTITDYEWNKNTNIITLQPRDVLILYWVDFRYWIYAIKDFIYEILNF